MDLFQAKIRGVHAKAVENIMARTAGFSKPQTKQKPIKSKGDNITTYLRKFQIDRENLNLAKRILLCESDHDHKFYQREWKKTQNFLRVRSNFKRGLCNQQPRIFKFQPIQGKGNVLITMHFLKFETSPVHFRPQNLYEMKILIKNNVINPTNSNFSLESLQNNPMCFYIPTHMKKKKIACKISEIKQNQIYQKGKGQSKRYKQQTNKEKQQQQQKYQLRDKEKTLIKRNLTKVQWENTRETSKIYQKMYPKNLFDPYIFIVFYLYLVVFINIQNRMLTGKIYKNKLSTLQQEFQTSQIISTKTLNRVKSQPGINPILNCKQQIENQTYGNIKSQEYQNFQTNTLTRTFVESPQQQENVLGANEHILEYERKMKDHIQKIQSRYQTKISQLQCTLEGKNQVIAQLKSLLKQREKTIEKMSEENMAMGTSRIKTSRFF